MNRRKEFEAFLLKNNAYEKWIRNVKLHNSQGHSVDAIFGYVPSNYIYGAFHFASTPEQSYWYELHVKWIRRLNELH